MGVCNCSMFCCMLLYVHSSIAIILMGKRELIALLNLSSWCLLMVEQLFLGVPRGWLRFVIVVFPDHTIFSCASRQKVSYKPVHNFSARISLVKDQSGALLSPFFAILHLLGDCFSFLIQNRKDLHKISFSEPRLCLWSFLPVNFGYSYSSCLVTV